MAGPMECFVDLDWATYVCPCRKSFCTRHARDGESDAFIRDHYAHTDGTLLDVVTDDGARVLTSKPAPKVVPLRWVCPACRGIQKRQPDGHYRHVECGECGSTGWQPAERGA